MATQTHVTAVLIDEECLTLEELARAVVVEPSWVVERVEAGLLGGQIIAQRSRWRFASAEVVRARCLISMERDMDANPEVAAMLADLIEEVKRLRQRLHAAGLPE